jgi:hypothetical protein
MNWCWNTGGVEKPRCALASMPLGQPTLRLNSRCLAFLAYGVAFPKQMRVGLFGAARIAMGSGKTNLNCSNSLGGVRTAEATALADISALCPAFRHARKSTLAPPTGARRESA